MEPTLSVIVPIYNEEEVLGASYERMTAVLKGMELSYEMIYIDDGSNDSSAEMLGRICLSDEAVKVLTLTRNFGHASAITAGMDYSRGDAVVVIDADLQDPPEIIPLMYEKWRQGYDVVYGKRLKRKGETLFKRTTAALFYRLLRRMSNIDIPLDTGDFRLIGRNVLAALKSLSEHNRFIRGLVSWVGFRQTYVEFVREERFAGQTKYPLRKMVELSINGMASFSKKPLRFAYFLGFITMFAGIAWLIASLALGSFAVVSLVVILQGLGFLVMGILGEYIGRIYDEVRGRPNYIVGKTRGFDD